MEFMPAWRARFLTASVSGDSSMTINGMTGEFVTAAGLVTSSVSVAGAAVAVASTVTFVDVVVAAAALVAAAESAAGLFWPDTATLPARSPLNIRMMILGFMFL